MIFELKNKMPRNSSFLHSEDVLTGIIFGNLRYFSNQNILVGFLNESILVDESTSRMNKLELTNEDIFKIKFWEKYYNDQTRRYNEPDLTLQNNNCIILIECKYHSPLGEEETINDNESDYSNQLIRYSKILSEGYNGLRKIIIFLTEDKLIPREIMEKSRKEIDKDIKLYWLSWNKLYLTLLKQDKEKLSTNERLLYDDLIIFLQKRDIIAFAGFNIGNVVCNYHYKR
jgi:hypothetical protein